MLKFNTITKIEDMLKASGDENWKIIYLPIQDGYIIKFNGDSIFMCDASKRSINND